MMREEKPELESFGKPLSKKWHASPQLEEEALQLIQGILPLTLRASDARLEECYEKGYNLYKAGRYKDALPYFEILTVAHFKEPRYLMALAATKHMLKAYEAAAQGYSLCSMLDPDNPMPQFHLADCCLQTKNPVAAYVALQMAQSRCKKNPKYKALQDRVEMMIESLKKEFDENKAKGVKYF